MHVQRQRVKRPRARDDIGTYAVGQSKAACSSVVSNFSISNKDGKDREIVYSA